MINVGEFEAYFVLGLMAIILLIMGFVDYSKNKNKIQTNLWNNGIHQTDGGSWEYINSIKDSNGYSMFYKCTTCPEVLVKDTYGEYKIEGDN